MRRLVGYLLLCLVFVAVALYTPPAHALLFDGTETPAGVWSYSGGNRAAQATFSVSGSSLTVTLTNTSSYDVLYPIEILTAVFFNLSGDPTLTTVSAQLAGGSQVWFGPSGGGNVGGEWDYEADIVDPPGYSLPDQGIGSAGLNVFGQADFNGPDLQPPTGVDGLQYGITSAGDIPTTGNTPVTGGSGGNSVALIKNSVVFTLSGLPGSFDVDDISDVKFNYGTSLDGTPAPEPATLLLLGGGLLGLAGVRKKFRK